MAHVPVLFKGARGGVGPARSAPEMGDGSLLPAPVGRRTSRNRGDRPAMKAVRRVVFTRERRYCCGVDGACRKGAQTLRRTPLPPAQVAPCPRPHWEDVEPTAGRRQMSHSLSGRPARPGTGTLAAARAYAPVRIAGRGRIGSVPTFFGTMQHVGRRTDRRFRTKGPAVSHPRNRRNGGAGGGARGGG